MMKKSILIFLILITILAACGPSEGNKKSENDQSNTEEIVMPEVKVQFESNPLPVQEKTIIQAIINQGEERVEDADYVEFEIWEDAKGQDSSEKIQAEHQGNGVYEASYSFQSNGKYQIIAHTQARDMHVMPQVEVMAGNKQTEDDSSETTEGHGHDHAQGEENNKGEFMVNLTKDREFKVDEEIKLTTHINRMETPFRDATVRFEISSDQMKNPQFIDTEESSAGEYTAQYTFTSPGEYTVKIHYEKRDKDIHGHQKETIQIVE